MTNALLMSFSKKESLGTGSDCNLIERIVTHKEEGRGRGGEGKKGEEGEERGRGGEGKKGEEGEERERGGEGREGEERERGERGRETNLSGRGAGLYWK